MVGWIPNDNFICDVDPPALLRKGCCAPQISPYHQAFHDYGWTVTLYVDLLLKNNMSVSVI